MTGTEAFFSRYDRILSLAFRLGELSSHHAMGVIDVPHARSDRVRAIDVSTRKHRKRRGHGHYSHDLLHLLAESSLAAKLVGKQWGELHRWVGQGEVFKAVVVWAS